MFYVVQTNAPVAHFEMINGKEVATHSIFALAAPMTVHKSDIVAEGYCSCGCGDKTTIVRMGATEDGCMYMRVFDADNAMQKAA